MKPPATKRHRLLEAMVGVASHHGYSGASVARVIERAGASRATFYEHFADREACFAEAHREIAAKLLAAGRAAARRAPPQEALAALLGALAGELAAEPSAARVLLVEALAGGPAVRAQHERLLAALEGEIERHRAATAAPRLSIPATALLGGLAGPLSVHLFLGEPKALPALGEDLWAWLCCYVPAAGEGEPRWGEIAAARALPRQSAAAPIEPARLPRGRSALSASEAGGARRERILAATARIVAQKGYAELTVAAIVAEARVSRAAFYSHFGGKEEAFLAAQAAALQESIGAAASGFFAASSWPQRVWGGLEALLAYLASHPDLARLAVLEAHAAGAAAIRAQHDARTAYTVFLEEGYREAQRAGTNPPRIVSEAIAGAIFALLRREILAARTAHLPEVLPQASYVALAPFLGAGAAAGFVRGRCGGGGGGGEGFSDTCVRD